MKKKILLGLKGAIFLILLLVSTASAQTFIASFGVQQEWGVPLRVSHYIEDHFYGYNWVHARKVVHHGSINFEVILQRGNVYLEVTFNPFGHIHRTVRRDYYPLYGHVCSNHCGYHSNYYNAYYVSINRHRHHSYVKYYHRPKGHTYGHYNSIGSSHYTKGYKNKHPKGHKSYNGYSSRKGESHYENKSNGRSNGSRDTYNRQNRNRTGNSNINGRKGTTTASSRPR